MASRPAHSRATAARRVALEVCTTVREREAYAHDVLEHYDLGHLDQKDRAFVRVLVLGVVATQGTLDEVIDRGLDSPDQAHGVVRDALRISTYEMLFLGKEAHAAVDQGVELVKHAKPKAARLANFALHRVAEARAEFPFADPDHDDAALARLHGFPLWLCEELVAQRGREAAAAFMQASNEPAPVFLAVNCCARGEQETLQELHDFGVMAKPVHLGPDEGAIPGCLKLARAQDIADEPIAGMLRDGRVIVSDASAQAIAQLVVSDLPDEAVSVLEIGAGRATKTVLMQSHAVRTRGAQVALTCVERHGFKKSVLLNRVQACKVDVEQVVLVDARDLGGRLEPASFDAVLVDAPCSGLGTLRRHPEIRWRLKREDVDELAKTSQALLCEASRHVKPGGRLVYSTCTALAQENEYVVKSFLESEQGSAFDIVALHVGGAQRLTFKTNLASGGPDAHFACVFKARG